MLTDSGSIWVQILLSPICCAHGHQMFIRQQDLCMCIYTYIQKSSKSRKLIDPTKSGFGVLFCIQDASAKHYTKWVSGPGSSVDRPTNWLRKKAMAFFSSALRLGLWKQSIARGLREFSPMLQSLKVQRKRGQISNHSTLQGAFCRCINFRIGCKVRCADNTGIIKACIIGLGPRPWVQLSFL